MIFFKKDHKNELAIERNDQEVEDLRKTHCNYRKIIM